MYVKGSTGINFVLRKMWDEAVDQEMGLYKVMKLS